MLGGCGHPIAALIGNGFFEKMIKQIEPEAEAKFAF